MIEAKNIHQDELPHTASAKKQQVNSNVLLNEYGSHWDYSEPSVYSLQHSIHLLFLCSCSQWTRCVCLAEKNPRTLAFQSGRANRERSALYYLSSSDQFGVICLLFSSSVARLFAVIASLSMLGGSSGCPFVLFFSHLGHLWPAVKTGKWQCLTVIVGGWRIPQGSWMVSRRSLGSDFTVRFCVPDWLFSIG